MANFQFNDESSSTTVMSGSSSGSFEFGSSTPSSSSCTCTADGTGINSGSNIGSGIVRPNANTRTTGSFSLNQVGTSGDTLTVSTGKSGYAVVVVNVPDPLNDAVYVYAMSAGSFTLRNYHPTRTCAGSYYYL
jgi:hypothetical protein